MKRLLFGLIALMLFGCAPQTDSAISKLASLPDLGPAPELRACKRITPHFKKTEMGLGAV
jgi:hypothetical protein